MLDTETRARNFRDQGIQALNAGKRAEGQELLAQSLEINPADEYAWLWIASTADTNEDQRFCLQKVLELNPANQLAREALAQLPPEPQPTHASAGGVAAGVGSQPAATYDRGKVLKAFGIMLLALALALFMTWKLHRVAQVRGWIEGRRVETYQITQKQVGLGKRGRSTYWVSWTNDSIQTPGDHRVNLPYERWQQMQIGDPLELVFVGDSTQPYLKKGDIWASDGNVIFDIVLLVGSLLTALLMGWYATYLRQDARAQGP